MADETDEKPAEEAAPKKKGGGMGLIIGVVLALGLGAGSAIAVMQGLAPIPGLSSSPKEEPMEVKSSSEPAPLFLPVDPITVTILQDGAPRQLRLSLSIETSEAYRDLLEANTPRMLDALNTLLRAVDANDLAQPWALDRLRAQMLRRIRIASDATAVRDLLITEYVIF